MGLYRHKETKEITDRKPYKRDDNWVYFPCKFFAQDYNFVAKRLRENFPKPLDYGDSRAEYLSVSEKVSTIALDFAKRYAEDNPNFDPHWFLDACSPDVEALPLSELWED